MIVLRILGYVAGGLVGLGVVIGIAGTLLILRRFWAEGTLAGGERQRLQAERDAEREHADVLATERRASRVDIARFVDEAFSHRSPPGKEHAN